MKAEKADGATETPGNEIQLAGKTCKTDEELKVDCKGVRKWEEEDSFQDVHK